MYPPRFVIHIECISTMHPQSLQLSFEGGSTNPGMIEICLPLKDKGGLLLLIKVGYCSL